MKRIPVKTASIYLIIGALWILLSDYALSLATKNNNALSQTLQTYKGWFFILVTALLLYSLLTRQIERIERVENQYRFLAENALDIVYRFRLLPNPGFDYVSPSITQITGYTPQEFYDDPLLIEKILYPDDLSSFRELIKNPKPEINLRLRLIRKDGSLIWTGQLGRTIYNRTGSPLALAGIARDITQHVEREEKMRQLLERFQATFDASPLAITVLDPEGHILEWNRAAEKTFGWSSEEAIGQVLGPLVGSPLDEFINALARIRAGGDFIGVEIVRRKKDGSPVRLIVSSAGLHDVEGKITGIISIFEDITTLRNIQHERELLETQLLHSQRLDAIGQFTGSIAHDFNNLLTAISMNASLIEGQINETHPHYDSMEEILRTTERAADLTRRLLTFSRREEVHTQPLDIDQAITDMLPLLNHLLGKKYHLETSFHGSLPSIMADERQVEQVIMNLAINARDAMPDGGTLRFRTNVERRPPPNTDLKKEQESADCPVLIVEDTGSGMDVETLSRIFEPFFTTKEPGQGTGLGLATVYSIVQGWHGEITADSTPGMETRFTLVFPPFVEVES
ncbi:MAG: PAS domain S-box protein [bacterium]